MLIKLKLPVLIFLFSILVACSTPNEIVGTWVEDIPGYAPNKQGMILQEDGKALSYNMATLQYRSWQRKGDQLTLTGLSIGNGLTSEFSETYTIERVTDKQLILKQGDQIMALDRLN